MRPQTFITCPAPCQPLLLQQARRKRAHTAARFFLLLFPNLLICLINAIPAMFSACSFPMELEERSPLAIACREPAAERTCLAIHGQK